MAIRCSVLSNKGGVGKTSLLANYATLLHEKNPSLKILLVDTDAQGNLSINFKRYLFNERITSIKNYENTLYDVLMGDCKVQDAIITMKENFDILPANADMNYFSMDVLSKPGKYDSPLMLLKEKLKELDSEYDYIFIDTPPSLELVTNMVLAATDQILIPLLPDAFGVAGLIQMVEAVERCKKNVNKFIEIKAVVPMMVDLRTTVHSNMLGLCRQYCETKDIFITFSCIKRSIRYADVVASEGVPIIWTSVKTSSNREAIQVYEDLYNELEEHLYSDIQK